MGKKTVGKKGQERVKHRDKEPSSLEEASDGKNELPMTAEADAELHFEDEKKNEHEHEASGQNVEFKATQSETLLEGGNNEDKKEKEKTKKKKKRHEISTDDVGVNTNGNGVVREEDDGVKKKKKIKQRHENTNEDKKEKEKKKKKKKKRHEISTDDVGLNTNENGVVRNEVDGVMKKKKIKQRNEIDGNDVELNASQIEATIESNAKEKRKKEKKKLQGIGGDDDIKFDGNQSGAVSKKRCEVSSDSFEFGTSQSEAVMDGDIDVNNYENEKDKKKNKKRKKEEVVKGQIIPEEKNIENSGKVKKRKKNHNGDLQDEKFRNVNSGVEENEINQPPGVNDEWDRNREGHVVEEDDKKKKVKSVKDHSDGGDRKVPRTKKDVASESSKKVSFSDHVQVFPSSDDSNDGLVRGKRFSEEEDELVKKAVTSYIESRKLGEEGLNMVLNCKSHKEVKNCWKEIGAALPWRPSASVYYRAHILFERDENRKWTTDELEYVKNFHEKHGSDWKTLAGALGKHRFHVKDAWRRIRLPNTKKGQWSQEEYHKLFELVNMDLRMKASEERKSKYGMLRDNISWEAISETLETRSNAICCMKWYDQLTSPMVVEGKWSDTDDYYLVNALSKLDACCMDDVDWDNILEHRSGSICRKRWNQMVKHLGSHGNKSFAEQVEILSTRYCLDVLEAREAYNSKPAVK